MEQVGRPLVRTSLSLRNTATQSQAPGGTCPQHLLPSQCPCPAAFGLCRWESWQQAPNICSNPSEPHTGVTAANGPMPRTRALCRRNDKYRNIFVQLEERRGREMPAGHQEQHRQTARTCVLWASRQVSRPSSCCPVLSTLQPVTFHFRSMTHLTILPRHAFV